MLREVVTVRVLDSYTRSMREVPSPDDARALARELREPLGDRWAHVQAVAARAEDLSSAAGIGRRGDTRGALRTLTESEYPTGDIDGGTKTNNN